MHRIKEFVQKAIILVVDDLPQIRNYDAGQNDRKKDDRTMEIFETHHTRSEQHGKHKRDTDLAYHRINYEQNIIPKSLPKIFIF